MYTYPSDRPQAEERYLSARHSSHLGHFAERPCDADKLLAAAYAARGNDRKRLAMDVHNVLMSTDMRGARGVAEQLAGWVFRRSLRERGGETMKYVTAKDLVLRLLLLWNKRTCMRCEGRGHPMIPNSPVLDTSRDCRDCRGTGLIPIERMVKPEHAKAARAIESEVLSLLAGIFKDMEDMLGGRKNLTEAH